MPWALAFALAGCFFLYLRSWAALPVLIAAVFLARAEMVYPERGLAGMQCTGRWEVDDFPKVFQSGQLVRLTPAGGSCDFLKRRTVPVFLPKTPVLAPADVIAADINISAGENSYRGEAKNAELLSDAPRLGVPLLRRWVRARIDAHFGEHAPWAEALILGLRDDVPAAGKTALQRTGTVHLLAISGLHLAVFALTVFFIARWLFVPWYHLRRRVHAPTFAIYLSIAAGFAFVLISGAQPPVVRAWIMYSYIIMLWHFKQFGRALWVLPGAVLLVLLHNPEALFALGAWLSMLAAAAVLLLLRKMRDWRCGLCAWAALQGGVTAVTVPVVWAVAGGIPLTGFLANFLLIPWLAPLLMVILAGVFWQPAAAFAGAALDWYLRPVYLLSQWRAGYWVPAWQPVLPAGILLGITVILLCCRRPVKFLAIATGSGALAVSLFVWLSAPDLQGVRGKAQLFTAGRLAVLVNTGAARGTWNDAERVILPVLRRRGLTLQAVVLTGDAAGMTGGMAQVLQAFPDVPVYSTVPLPLAPFAVQYCPERAAGGLAFVRGVRCQALFAGGIIAGGLQQAEKDNE